MRVHSIGGGPPISSPEYCRASVFYTPTSQTGSSTATSSLLTSSLPPRARQNSSTSGLHVYNAPHCQQTSTRRGRSPRRRDLQSSTHLSGPFATRRPNKLSSRRLVRRVTYSPSVCAS